MQRDSGSPLRLLARRHSPSGSGFLTQPGKALLLRATVLLGVLLIAAIAWRSWPLRHKTEAPQVPAVSFQTLSPEEAARQWILRSSDSRALRRLGAERLLARPRAAFVAMMAVLDGPRSRTQRDGITGALFDVRRLSTPLMLDHLANHPRSPSAKICALVLGLIAAWDIQRGIRPDDRIEPALAGYTLAMLQEGTASARLPVHALTLITQQRPVPGIAYIMAQVLDRAGKEGPSANPHTVQEAAQTIVASGGELPAKQLAEMAEALPEDAPLRRGIEEVLLKRHDASLLND